MMTKAEIDEIAARENDWSNDLQRVVVPLDIDEFENLTATALELLWQNQTLRDALGEARTDLFNYAWEEARKYKRNPEEVALKSVAFIDAALAISGKDGVDAA
jgi:hypothetical protein